MERHWKPVGREGGQLLLIRAPLNQSFTLLLSTASVGGGVMNGLAPVERWV